MNLVINLDAFKNNRSTFMKESGGSHRWFKVDEDNWGMWRKFAGPRARTPSLVDYPFSPML